MECAISISFHLLFMDLATIQMVGNYTLSLISFVKSCSENLRMNPLFYGEMAIKDASLCMSMILSMSCSIPLLKMRSSMLELEQITQFENLHRSSVTILIIHLRKFNSIRANTWVLDPKFFTQKNLGHLSRFH